MNIILNFKGIIRQYVAPHRRQRVRLKWLYALLDLDGVWESFSSWRDYYRYKVHVTSQHKSLQGHLNKTFGGGILVKSYEDQFLDIGLNTEPAHLCRKSRWRARAGRASATWTSSSTCRKAWTWTLSGRR